MINKNFYFYVQLSAVVISTFIGTLEFSQAQAATIMVEPDNFAVGVDIRSAFPGVTLSVQGEPSTQVIVVDGYSTFVGKNVATTGTKMFGQSPATESAIPDAEKNWDESTFGLLRADFASPVDYVQIDLIFDDDDTGFLKAFDAGGNLLATFTGQGDGRGTSSPYCPPFCSPSVTASITRPTADIAYILAGGTGAEGHYLDNLQVHAVPLPSALVLFASGFFPLLFKIRKHF